MSRRKRVQAGEVAWKRKAGAGSGLGTPGSGNVVRADEIGLPKNTQVLLWHTRKLLANMDDDLKTGGASSSAAAAATPAPAAVSTTRRQPRRVPRKRGTDLKPMASSSALASEGGALFRSHSADAAGLGSHHNHTASEPRESLGLEVGGAGGAVAHSAHTSPEEEASGKAARRVRIREDDGFDDDFWGAEGQRQRASNSKRDGAADKRRSAALARLEQGSDGSSPSRSNLEPKGGLGKGGCTTPRR